MAAARPSALRLIGEGEQLAGIAAPALERAAMVARAGDAVHQGLIRLGASIARPCVRACIPPSATLPVLTALEVAEAWAAGQASAGEAAKSRSEAFSAMPALEQRTIEAVAASTTFLPQRKHTLIDEHADAVVLRYAGLAANYACGAALLVLDAVARPVDVIAVPRQAAGALAYQRVGLGAARSPDLRAAACEQAEWESERRGAPPGHGTGALAIQLFHEFLGARWKDHSDAERARLDDLCIWALGGARTAD